MSSRPKKSSEFLYLEIRCSSCLRRAIDGLDPVLPAHDLVGRVARNVAPRVVDEDDLGRVVREDESHAHDLGRVRRERGLAVEQERLHVGADAHAVVLDEPRVHDRVEPRVVAALVHEFAKKGTTRDTGMRMRPWHVVPNTHSG